MNEKLQTIHEAVVEGNLAAVKTAVQSAVEAGIPGQEILNTGLIPAMSKVGCMFEEGEYFVPEMLIAARAMKGGLEIIKPLLVDSGNKPIGKVAVGTVKGDLHDIGKNLVAMMLEGAGFEIVDLGTDVDPEKYVEAARSGVNIIGLSALLTTTMANMDTTIRAIEQAGLRNQVKIIVGGAPVTSAYAKQIGADGFAPDASQAANLAKTLIGA
jgi:5-methyltetrahydrofolate--homocysteine methyltransferase